MRSIGSHDIERGSVLLSTEHCLSEGQAHVVCEHSRITEWVLGTEELECQLLGGTPAHTLHRENSPFARKAVEAHYESRITPRDENMDRDDLCGGRPPGDIRGPRAFNGNRVGVCRRTGLLRPGGGSYFRPSALQFGGRSTFAVKVENPNAAGTCGDDGIIVLITFNGTPDAIDSIDPGDDMVCSAAQPGLFASKERCVGSAFAGGSKATISIDAHIDGTQDRIAAEVQTLHQTLKPRMRPGQSGLRDLIVTSALSNAPAPKPEGSPSLPSLKQGASGDTVSTLQWLLRHHGQDLDVDGDFGDETASAVKAFQSSRGITPGRRGEFADLASVVRDPAKGQP